MTELPSIQSSACCCSAISVASGLKIGMLTLLHIYCSILFCREDSFSKGGKYGVSSLKVVSKKRCDTGHTQTSLGKVNETSA